MRSSAILDLAWSTIRVPGIVAESQQQSGPPYTIYLDFLAEPGYGFSIRNVCQASADASPGRRKPARSHATYQESSPSTRTATRAPSARTERNDIATIFGVVAEDYAPFDVNVTTIGVPPATGHGFTVVLGTNNTWLNPISGLPGPTGQAMGKGCFDPWFDNVAFVVLTSSVRTGSSDGERHRPRGRTCCGPVAPDCP